MAQPPTIRRAWLTISQCDTPGKIGLTVSYRPVPMTSDCMVQLLSRGNLPPDTESVSMEVVSDPSLARGPAGPQGLKGDKGDAGDRGPQGPAGAIGAAGSVGPAGPKGDTGSQGVAGPVGSTGAQGPKGDQGATGAAGAVGPAGTKGDIGATGPQGATGAVGPAGAKGDTGAPGAALLGTIAVAETIPLAVGVGIRRVTITTPTAWAVKAGDNLLLFPAAVPAAGFAVHDVEATAANTIVVGVSTPALAVLASYSIACRVVRINAA